MPEAIQVTIEGQSVSVEEREYSGAELRKLAGLGEQDKLVREEADGSETPVPATKQVHVRPGENYFKSVRHRRG